MAKKDQPQDDGPMVCRVLVDVTVAGVRLRNGQLVELPAADALALELTGAVDTHPDAVEYLREQGVAVVRPEQPSGASDGTDAGSPGTGAIA